MSPTKTVGVTSVVQEGTRTVTIPRVRKPSLSAVLIAIGALAFIALGAVSLSSPGWVTVLADIIGLATISIGITHIIRTRRVRRHA